MAGTRLKVWWKCEKGHSYEASISNRTYKNQGCPYCAGKRVLKGFNDLETTCADLINEWNYEKNELLPENYSKGSQKIVWWKCCKCGSEWEAPINYRSRGKYKCPKCK